MLTDAPPRRRNRTGFLESDRIKTLDLPENGHLISIAKSIETAMQSAKTADVRRSCIEFLSEASRLYRVPECRVRVLAAYRSGYESTGRPNCLAITTPRRWRFGSGCEQRYARK
jgi:hypothetical protein